MSAQFSLPKNTLPGVMNFDVIRDDGHILSFAADNNLGISTGAYTRTYVTHFTPDDATVTHHYAITPEIYLEMLAGFLGYTITPPSLYNANPTDDQLRAIIMPLLNASDKNWIQAIKAVREYTGWGLREAKDAVDPYRTGNKEVWY